MWAPPLMSSTSPVNHAALVRNSTASAMSSGVPARPSGVFSTYSSTTPGMAAAASVSGVWTNPGATALTRIPRPASSSAATWVSIESPAFAEQYALIPAAGWRPLSELIDTSEPPSVRRLPAYLATMNAPVRQTSITERKSSTGMSTMSPTLLKPAQLTTASTGPVCSKRVATEASSLTSTNDAVWGAPSSAALACAPSRLRSATTTRYPSAAKARADAQPMPDAAPTTIAMLTSCSPQDGGPPTWP